MTQRTGQLQGTDAEHPASGSVIVTERNLRLENTAITQAPDAQVFLTLNFDTATGVNLGSLKQFSGSDDYTISEGTDTGKYDSVVIWCDQFSVPIGKARLST